MTISLRQLYLLFGLALVLAFALHSKADTGNWWNKVQDGLADDGSLRDSTNCIQCGFRIACGDLSQSVGKLTLFDACKAATDRVNSNAKVCEKKNSIVNLFQVRFQTKVKKVDYATVKPLVNELQKDYPIFYGKEGSQMDSRIGGASPRHLPPVVTIPSFDHWQKLKFTQPSEKPRSLELSSENKDILGQFSPAIQKEVESCISNANRKIENEFRDQVKQEFKTQRKDGDFSREVYMDNLRNELSLDPSSNSYQYGSVNHVCETIPNAASGTADTTKVD